MEGTHSYWTAKIIFAAICTALEMYFATAYSGFLYASTPGGKIVVALCLFATTLAIVHAFATNDYDFDDEDDF